MQKNIQNKQGKVWLNVASSVYVIDDFINLDNHIFLSIMWLYRWFKFLIPGRYHGLFEKYNQAMHKATLIRHDCRKPLPFAANSADHILCSHFLEHVFPDEMERIVLDFKRVLKPGGTLHIIVPNLENQIKTYLEKKKNGAALAADEFIDDTLLSKRNRGTLKYRLMEFSGGFGLQHRWMYDQESMEHKIKNLGFSILSTNETPSKAYRENDDSVHLVGIK